jgi:hypothetical protein
VEEKGRQRPSTSQVSKTCAGLREGGNNERMKNEGMKTLDHQGFFNLGGLRVREMKYER